MADMYYAITIEGREMISAAEDPEVARHWATQYTSETGMKAVVVKAMEFYKAGYRVPKKDVDLEDFKP